MKHKNCTDEEEQDHAVPPDPLMPCLEPMQLNSVFRDALFGEEIGNLDPLVTLKLNDLTHLLIVNEIAVASKFLQNLVSQRPKIEVAKKTFLKALRSFLGSYSARG